MELQAERRTPAPALHRWRTPALRRRGPTLLNSYDLLLLCGLELLLPFLPGLPVQSGVIAVIRAALGVAAALVAPGFAMVAALFPRGGDLDGQSRAALSFGLSIAAIAVLAVVLSLGPWGIRPAPIALALALWIGVFGGVAIGRRLRLPSLDPDRHPWAPEAPKDLVGGQGTPSGAWVSRGLAAAVLAVVVFSGLTMLSIDRVARTTEFYMLGDTGQAEYYPRAVAPDQPLSITIGLVNRERMARTYRVEVWSVDGLTPDRQSLLVQGAPVVLDAGEQHEQTIVWRMPQPGTYRVEFRLVVDDASAGGDLQAEPYRRLNLWVDVAEAEKP